MSAAEPLTAEQFTDELLDLPDAGRWVELEQGRLLTLDPPDEAHGNVVLNVSKALGEYLGTRRDNPVGYACFEIGLIVERQPDTVRRPPVSFFSRKDLFAEADALVTETVPELVIEAATTHLRRRGLTTRIGQYHRFGVQQVWVADPVERVVHLCERERTARQLTEQRTLSGEPFLPGFALTVAELFAEPQWWRHSG